jgi:hypothetical protein
VPDIQSRGDEPALPDRVLLTDHDGIESEGINSFQVTAKRRLGLSASLACSENTHDDRVGLLWHAEVAHESVSR